MRQGPMADLRPKAKAKTQSTSQKQVQKRLGTASPRPNFKQAIPTLSGVRGGTGLPANTEETPRGCPCHSLMAVWVAVNLNTLQANSQSFQIFPLLPERINVVASGTCQPSHNKAWLDRLWWTP
eukprot:4032579-Amphidinium_carterae.1